jgi:hypothetical protein
MDVENPLTRFFQGGDETLYYEPDLYQAQFGLNFTRNNMFGTRTPATQGLVDVGNQTQEQPIEGLEPTPFWNNQSSFNPPTPEVPGEQPDQYEIDEKQTAGYMEKPETRNMFMPNVNPEQMLNKANSRMRGFLGRVDQRQRSKDEINQTLNNTDPMNIYASNNDMDKGDWNDVGSKSGLFRYNQMGSDRNSRSTFGNYATAKNGGYMAQGGTYQDDEEVYMSPEELEEFLAAGGQVEYL